MRVTGVLPFSPTLPELKSADSADASAAKIGTRKVCLDGRIGYTDTDVYDYSKLLAGHVLQGPAIVEVPTTTVVVPHETTGTVDRLGNLNIVAQ